MTELVDNLKLLLGAKTAYSRCGGGAGSILLFNFTNNLSLWNWGYWEILHNSELIACADDDDTPITGTMPKGALALEAKRVLGFTLYPDYSLGLFFDDGYEFWIFTDEDSYIGEKMSYWELENWTNRTSFKIDRNHKIIGEKFNL